jgi:mRNA interferase MazF
MGAPSAREVVIVPFPFSDLSQTKVRPALVLAYAQRGDWMLCQITSSPYGDPTAVSVADADFETGGEHAQLCETVEAVHASSVEDSSCRRPA